MDIDSTHNDLVSTLMKQNFDKFQDEGELISIYKRRAEAYVTIDNSMAVLSDFTTDKSYIYTGDFGQVFGLSAMNQSTIESAFEDCIFRRVHPDDLTERHILELRYFQLQKNTPKEERHKYNTISHIRIRDVNNDYRYVTHRTIYLASLPNDAIWLALCLYSPDTEQYVRNGIEGKIVNNATGDIIPADQYSRYDKTILTKRELDVLKLVAQGNGSKQIAQELNIAVYTVHRHRQNIITKMQVANAAEAVKTALTMGIIHLK